ncbi:GspH/FimT family pseudopilin [Alteromonas oceanisediminis]|uniref:GspH/FimT family pseudopilin n=1 Tax=Alteromonas oceanisediminis TaxID=2836180 RepID=UPI001BDA3D55|nr:GspH/FimT family pseudopilin [Alteromonas oceanisediminis]MBT0586070.1 GspH/FimT family pseudopilin [Alteromonas oceanisediminis]
MEFRNPKLTHGVTLIEMMIAIAVLAIVLLSVAPDMRFMLAKHRMISELNSLSSLLQMTRFLAIDNQRSATLCPARDLRTCEFTDWNLPKIVFSDSNNNKVRDNDEALLSAINRSASGVTVTGPKKTIRFLADGVVGSPATLLLCPTRTEPRLNRALVISLQGRIRTSKDANNDDIHEVSAKKPVPCP